MDKALAFQWADDIERFPQAKHRLCMLEVGGVMGFCCLGVAQFITLKTPAKFDGTGLVSTDLYDEDDTPNGFEVLTRDAQRRLGMFSVNGARRDGEGITFPGWTSEFDDGYSSLASANDAGVPREMIAQYIRENWEQL